MVGLNQEQLEKCRGKPYQNKLPKSTRIRDIWSKTMKRWRKTQQTGAISTCPLHSHYLVCRKNNSYFVGIEPQIKKDLFEVCVVCKKYYLVSNKGQLL